jgi:hypothetical protein
MVLVGMGEGKNIDIQFHGMEGGRIEPVRVNPHLFGPNLATIGKVGVNNHDRAGGGFEHEPFLAQPPYPHGARGDGVFADFCSQVHKPLHLFTIAPKMPG